MHKDEAEWLDTVHKVAKKFVENNYFEEASLFDPFWQSFSFQLEKHLTGLPFEHLTLDSTRQVLSEISLTRTESIDLMTPIIIGAVVETAYALKSRELTSDELKSVIVSAAARLGAKSILTACLTKNLPMLFVDLLSQSKDFQEALVRKVPDPQYRIWTGGKEFVEDKIKKYQDNRNSFIIWLDLDKQSETKERKPDQKAIRLLRYLVEHIGSRISIEDVKRELYYGPIDHINNLIGQHLTQLHNYSGKQFRPYLFPDWTSYGLGLDDAFKDKYFIFTRLSSTFAIFG